MRFGTAIERLVDNYQYAKSKIWIRDEVAWALYHTWKEADDRKTEPSNSEKPNNCEPKICDTCRYYNSNIPCGSTPSVCKEADKFAEEFVDGLKKLKQTEPTISKMEQVDKDINVRSKDCETCKWGEWYRKGCDITMMDDECSGCCSWNNKWQPKDEPQTDIHGITDCDFCKHGSEEWDSEACDGCCNANNHFEPKDEPQRDCFLCKWLGDVDVCGRCRNRNLFAEADTEPKPKDEPQTCSFSDCDNFKNPDYARCIECKRKQIESKTEPQTERNNYHRSRKVCTLELFDDDGNYIEPQTDCAWR